MSKVDFIYRKLLLTKYFTKGWGNPDGMKRLFKFRRDLSGRDNLYNLVSKDYPVKITKDVRQNGYHIMEGQFVSPFHQFNPGLMVTEVQMARFEVVLPDRWPTHLKPVVLQLAGTGDHNFWRRKTLMAKPLIKEYGIGSIILENPYYGTRKPKGQLRSSLHNVTDLFVMGGALILESTVLLNWCERQGFGPLGLTGISMGGYMASLAAANWPKPISLVPCLSWSTASSVFTQGVMSGAIPWKLLAKQFFSDDVYENEIAGLLHSPENSRNESFNQDNQFAKTNQEKDIVLADSSRIQRTNAKNHTNSEGRSSIKSNDKKAAYAQAVRFMRGVMDEFTHLGNYPVPCDPQLAVIIVGRSDAYVPRESVLSLQELWPGSEVRELDCGHIVAFLRKQHEFRKAIKDSLDRQAHKYYAQRPVSTGTPVNGVIGKAKLGDELINIKESAQPAAQASPNLLTQLKNNKLTSLRYIMSKR